MKTWGLNISFGTLFYHMKIAIIGTGGAGGYFGGKLSQAGNDVTFLARGEHLKAIKNKGLSVKSISGDFLIHPAKATDKISEIGKSDLIILGVKAWQVKEIAKQLKTIVGTETSVIPLQNGILAAEELSSELNPQNILCGLCKIMSKIESPGIINHFGIEPAIIFGEQDNSKTDWVFKIKELFEKAGVKAKVPDDIHVELWKKFIPICGSALLAVAQSTYGEMLELKETRKLMYDLLNEIYMLSQKVGINVKPDYVEKSIAFMDTFPYDSTSSLTRDVWEGKPSEIEYQNGTVVRLGEKYGVNTPVNRFIYDCILPMEIRTRKNLK
jgi:2-dehydropantoate 2-reductase